MAPRRRIFRQAASPAAKELKPKARRSCAGGRRVDAQARFGDHAERALAAHEELGQVGPGGGAGAVPLGAHGAAVGQDDLEAEHHVLDLAVAGGVLPGAAAGEPSAHRREIHRLRPVAEGVAGPDPAQRPLEIGAEGARPHVGGERGLVHAEQAVERRQVERDPAEDGDGAAAHPAAARNGRDRDDGLVAGRQDGGDLGGGGWAARRGRDGGGRRPAPPTRWPGATSPGPPRPGRRRRPTPRHRSGRGGRSGRRAGRRWDRAAGRSRTAGRRRWA